MRGVPQRKRITLLPNIETQSPSLNLTIDTFHIKRGCPYRGAYKTFTGRSMAAGLCMYVRLSIFIKSRETSKGDRVAHLCELSGGVGQEGVLCEWLSKAFADQTLWRSFMASVNHLANVLKPKQVGVTV